MGLRRGRANRKVVVVTGASSGIGRATATRLAKRGASLVLAARSRSSLDEVRAECVRLGARAIAVPTDITEEGASERLVQAAVEEFGRLDVWIGAASVYGYGTFEQTPAEVFRKMVETNLLGEASSIRAVLPQFRRQRHGVLILVGSIYSKMTTPYVSAYVASKSGLLGLANVLRQELLDEKGVHICTVLPATIDTPIFQHAANYTGRKVRPLPPVASPRRVAKVIARLAHKPRRQVVVGRTQRLFIPFQHSIPGLYDRFSRPLMNTVALHGSGVAPTAGTVFAPDPPSNRVNGGWRSPGTRLLAGGAFLGLTVAGCWLGTKRRLPQDRRRPFNEGAPTQPTRPASPAPPRRLANRSG
jgi:short-subunit dehydrogenase